MKKETKKELITYVVIIILVVLIRNFIVTPVRVNGTSMDNTLKANDILLLNKISYRFNDIKRFDIVVINHKEERLIKRVIGLPGETLEIKEGILYINNKEIKEAYLEQTTEDYSYEGKIPKDCYFVMGDNRGVSLDSRYFGCFKKQEITGKTNIRLYPFNKIGKVS